MEFTDLHPAVTFRLYTDQKCFGPGVAMLMKKGYHTGAKL